MNKDAFLLRSIAHDPIFHVYRFSKKSYTYGMFVHPERLLSPYGRKLLQGAKRPTGGGLVFHLWDFTFSLIIPKNHPLFCANPEENYKLINSYVLSSLSLPQAMLLPQNIQGDEVTKNFCFAKPTIYDVMYQTTKIGGCAQRKTRDGLLHQSSLMIAPFDQDFLEKVVLHPESVIPAMEKHSHFLPNTSYNDLKNALFSTFKNT